LNPKSKFLVSCAKFNRTKKALFDKKRTSHEERAATY